MLRSIDKINLTTISGMRAQTENEVQYRLMFFFRHNFPIRLIESVALVIMLSLSKELLHKNIAFRLLWISGDAIGLNVFPLIILLFRVSTRITQIVLNNKVF